MSYPGLHDRARDHPEEWDALPPERPRADDVLALDRPSQSETKRQSEDLKSGLLPLGTGRATTVRRRGLG